MNNYDDIINLPHYRSQTRKPMSMENRAAQFAPFAALSGHSEAISETGRLTSSRTELSDDELLQLSRSLTLAIEKEAVTEITYFQPDKSKAGGAYKTASGIIRKIVESERILILSDGEKLPLDSITAISLPDNLRAD